MVLTELNYIGVRMCESNPFIAELCVDSHFIESAWWEYYDHRRQTKGVVAKMIYPKQRDGLKKQKDAYRPGEFFYVSVNRIR